MIENVAEQRTIMWLKDRLAHFTASVAHTINVNGKGLETLAKKLAIEKITKVIPESYTNEDIERGNQLEDEARQIYVLEKNVKVVQTGFIELNENVGCSPDGLVGEDGLVEIKCPNDKNFFEAVVGGKIKPEYISQCQFQMMVTGRKWNDLVLYNPNFQERQLFIKRIKRDEIYINQIKKGLEKGIKLKNEFINKYMKG
jgi:putative phage-type endonuclease